MLPSGPKVIAVGRLRPVAISVWVPSELRRRILPVPGVGNSFPPVVFSRT